ncbi:hypothetical protein [Porphyromonas levii]|uniref:DNA-binding protein n=1 Tax=Porphyromonas levii TaxID=28114 RepID=A0A4Y8WQP2_9PORP|nr:hypothetical protein [Porphyromonas levii]MBR8703569.1 hypothetical protein [Porphyromonas levii]MBR8712676.1 hypothetical protein [Porphyromonas levii]MBR8714710.1 hypothetical protein [Porphyromonas levii]MBR8727194.1 hypothetical protein [Porphyromonas levii]MBR8729535.1 hypothetical protein [Porphyromonas levii]
MTKTVTFNKLRAFKNSLPHGAIAQIADELGLKEETVRNYFGGNNFKEGEPTGSHLEPGPEGGIVVLDDVTIWDKAQEILEQSKA